MSVTIVANEHSEEERKKFQEEADHLVDNFNTSPYAIGGYLAEKYNLAVSVQRKKEQMTLTCYPRA